MTEFRLVQTKPLALTGSLSVAPAGPPHTYLGVATSLLPGLRALSTAPGECSVALALVAAHIVECTLKAYLSRAGSDAGLRERKVRHNLELLWSRAEADGLSVATTPPDWLLVLHRLHDEPYPLRYARNIYGIATTSAQPMCGELEALVESVRACVAK